MAQAPKRANRASHPCGRAGKACGLADGLADGPERLADGPVRPAASPADGPVGRAARTPLLAPAGRYHSLPLHTQNLCFHVKIT